MKKLTLFRLSFLLLALLLPNITHAGMDFHEVDGIYYYTNGEYAIVLTPPPYDENYYSGDLTIPSTVDFGYGNLPVIGIDISPHPHLTSITIPNSVTSLRLGWCTGLTSIEIPNSVISLNLRGCSGLTSVTIPNSVTSIDIYAFEGCTGLTSIEIPNSVTTIGIDAFSGCTGLTSVTIPNSVTSIYEGAFRVCSGLTSVDIPNSVTTIGDVAFEGCTGLTSIEIPNSVTFIGKDAFEGCTGLKTVYFNAENCRDFTSSPFHDSQIERIVIGDNVITIPAYLAYDLTGLTEITIPNSVTSIGKDAFGGCSGLTSVTIPNSVTSIGNYAFSSCTGLTSVIIGSGVTVIYSQAFGNCDALESVKCLGMVPPAMASIDCFSEAAYNNATLYVPSGCEDSYNSTRYWYLFAHIEEMDDEPGDVNGDGVMSIADVTSLIDLLLDNGSVPEVGDVNGDGQVTIADVTALIDMLLGN